MFKYNPLPAHDIMLLEFFCLDGYFILNFDYAGGANVTSKGNWSMPLPLANEMQRGIHMCPGVHSHVIHEFHMYLFAIRRYTVFDWALISPGQPTIPLRSGTVTSIQLAPGLVFFVIMTGGTSSICCCKYIYK